MSEELLKKAFEILEEIDESTYLKTKHTYDESNLEGRLWSLVVEIGDYLKGDNHQGWLPIETAPKDEVVICYDDFYGGLYFCRWDGSTRYGDGTPRLHPIDDSTDDFQFTHWMPLPPTPKD